MLIHVRSHPDELVGELCDLLAVPPDDPFAPEVVAVPTRGIERWLTQRIAMELGRRDAGGGVCANVEFPSPRRFVRRVLLSTPELDAAVDAWEGTALTRTVVSVVDEHLDEPWMWLLSRFIGVPAEVPGLGNSRRLRAARKVGGLFTRYTRRRPRMVRGWLEGNDLGPDGDPLAEGDLWQPRLWRLVRERIGAPSLAELIPDGLDPVKDGSVDAGLPERVFVYGLTAVDPLDLDVLEAVAARRDIHLFLLHPSPELWTGSAARLERLPPDAVGMRRETDPTAGLARHPLLRSWGQESRELQVVLAGRGHTGRASSVPEGAGAAELLCRLQRDIRSNSLPSRGSGAEPSTAPGWDRSVQIHVCHGARRQVEVLRDAILHVLAADSTLEPRDVVIMTPDLATFAPLLEAVFLREAGDGDPEPAAGATNLLGRTSGDALPDLRLRIADRAPAATNPLVRFADTVLDLAGSRLEAGRVRELVAMPAVRRLFGFDEEAADEIASVIEDINVRWGLDDEHRTRWKAGAFADQTWRRGLDRALAGVFYSDSSVRVVGSVAPLDGVEGIEARPVGLLAQIIDRLVAVRDILGAPRPHSEWGQAIATAVRLLAAPAPEDQWQWGRLERLLADSFPDDGAGKDDPLIGPAEARLVVNDWSRETPSPLHFRTGDMTVCTLVPMRSVPYRVVCLLGMDDARFPRSSRLDGDDLLADGEFVGDPDRGAEDRQLLLDAVMAAGDRLVITYSGRDELTNAAYPPAVPVADLTDTLYDMVGEVGLERIVTRHPLQPFSEANFVAGRLGASEPWGFDPTQLAGALAVQERADRDGPARIMPGPVPPPADISLDELGRFLENPARYYVRARLGFGIPEVGEIPDDTLAARLDALGEWKVTNRLLLGLLDGHPIEPLEARERGADALPPGALGRAGLRAARDRATGLWDAARRVGYDPERHVQFSGAVSVGGRRVDASITADPVNSRIDLVTPSRLRGRQRLRAFVRLVFLTALDPERSWHGLLIGRRLRGDRLWSVTIQRLGDRPERRKQAAERLLSGLVALYVEGVTSPIPLAAETAYAWQRNLGSGRGAAFKAARAAWETDRFAPEGRDPAVRLLFPHLAAMSALAGSAFPDYARRVWGPILPLLREKAG